MSESVQAAVRKIPSFGWLANNTNTFPTVLETEKPKVRTPADRGLVRGRLLAQGGTLQLSLTPGRGEGALWSLFDKDTDPFRAFMS